MTTEERCQPCHIAEDGVTLRCWNCKQVCHIHSPIWRNAEPGDFVRVICPGCVTRNICRKPKAQIAKGARLVDNAVQLELVA